MGRSIWIYSLHHHPKIGRKRTKGMHVFDEPIGDIANWLTVPYIDKDRSRIRAVVRLVPQVQFLTFCQGGESAVRVVDVPHA